MGRRYRRRNYQKEDGFNPNFIHQSSNRWDKRPDNRTNHTGVHLGKYPVTGWEGHNNSNGNRNSFRLEPTNHRRPNDSFSGNHSNTAGNPFQSHPFPPQFQVGSKYFREYLITSINQILRRVHQWYPDEETSDNDMMDWQPEMEVIISQPRLEVHCVWGSAAPPNYFVLDDADKIDMKKRAHYDEPILGKRRTASEGNLGPGYGNRLFDGAERERNGI